VSALDLVEAEVLRATVDGGEEPQEELSADERGKVCLARL
jgi:hypothetical protein